MTVREKRAMVAGALLSEGLTKAEIASRMGFSQSYVYALFSDPDGKIEAERKKRYGGTCERCGAQTSHGSGAIPSLLCMACYHAGRPRAQHGTRSKYMSGCRCDACTASLRDYMRTLKGKPPPTHGKSGYQNYGCRCDVCKAAHSEAMKLRRRKVAA